MRERRKTDGNARPEGHEEARLHRKKKRVIVGSIVAVVAVAVLGFNAWHNTPGFCDNTVCHDVMAPYVQTYSQAAGQAGSDKWGNDVSSTDSMLAVVHASHDVSCLDCHVSDVRQQVGEVAEVLGGSYAMPLFETSATELLSNANHPSASGTGDELCMNDACHSDLSRETLTQMTSDRDFNPHAWEHGYEECTDCHKSHRASVLTCTECHLEARDSLPQGWVDARTGSKLAPVIAEQAQ